MMTPGDWPWTIRVASAERMRFRDGCAAESLLVLGTVCPRLGVFVVKLVLVAVHDYRTVEIDERAPCDDTDVDDLGCLCVEAVSFVRAAADIIVVRVEVLDDSVDRIRAKTKVDEECHPQEASVRRNQPSLPPQCADESNQGHKSDYCIVGTIDYEDEFTLLRQSDDVIMSLEKDGRDEYESEE